MDFNTFVAQNGVFDTVAAPQGQVDRPSEQRTYTAVLNAYCRDNDLTSADIAGYEQFFCDAGVSNALCISEEACRGICSDVGACYGIDVSTAGDRCYLNGAGCSAQYGDSTLGSSLSYKFLVKDGYTRKLTADTRGYGLSDGEVLRYKPVTFTTGGSYKVCFCDSSLLPAGQEHCLGESDYDIHAGDLVVSGVSCLLANQDFRRRTCYDMFHGGLACTDNDQLVLPNDASLVNEVNSLPSSYALY